VQWEGWIAAVALALLAGIGAGWWFALRALRENFNLRLRRAVEGTRQQHLATADKLRAAQAATQTELERLRTSVHRQISVATAEPRAAAARFEDRLRMAYAELDRLRQQLNGPAPNAKSEHSDGFALTQPWDGLMLGSTGRN